MSLLTETTFIALPKYLLKPHLGRPLVSYFRFLPLEDNETSVFFIDRRALNLLARCS